MKRVIVNYAKLTDEILNLLSEKFPEGYDETDIVRFRNANNELVEAVEVNTSDTIYLVKVSTKLADRMERYEYGDDDVAEDDIDVLEPIDGIKIDDDEEHNDDEDDEIDPLKDPAGHAEDYDDEDDDEDSEMSDESAMDDDEDDFEKK